MKKINLFLSALLIILSSCSKKGAVGPAKQSAIDEAAIKAYLAVNTSIHATRDPSGLYYQVIEQGTGNNPTKNSVITANFSSKLLNGTTFYSGAVTNVLLSDVLIKGWAIGIPFVKAGGSILLIIPSELGYGSNPPDVNIPVNAVLVYTINLTSAN